MSSFDNPPPPWAIRELSTGLMKLLALSLDGQPAHDVTSGTIKVWVEAICTDRVWDERRDTGRFRKAFRTLMTTRETWPKPRNFLEALPKQGDAYRAHLRLEHDGTRRARMQTFKEVREMLGIQLPADADNDSEAA